MKLQDGEWAKTYITQYLKNMTEKDMCAVYMIDVEHAADMAQKSVWGEQENISHHTEHTLPPVFGESVVASRFSEHEFIVFCPEDMTEEEAAGKAKVLCEQISSELGHVPEWQDAFYIGVYLAHGGGISFEKLSEQASSALCEAKKRKQGNYYILNDRKMPKPWENREEKEITGILPDTLLEYMESGAALLEVGADIQVIYASHVLCHMLGRDRKTFQIPCRLSAIGIHPDYEADYESALRKGAKREGVTEHVHRITSNGKDWIWRHVRAVRVDYPGKKNPVMLELSTDISQLVRTERQLRLSNERLRAGFGQTPYILWEVDTEECVFNIYNVVKEKCERDTIVADFPKSFLDKGIVHPDSAADFLEFSEKLMNGSSAGRGNFRMREHAGRNYGWVTMSYRMTYNEEGRPFKAVGVWSKFPELSGMGSGVMMQRFFPETARRHLFIRMRINLTKDSIDEFWVGGMDQTAWAWGKPYSGLVKSRKQNLFRQNDQEKFQVKYGRERLLQNYEEGQLWLTEEYQHVDEAGTIGWIMILVNLVKDEKSGDICMYAGSLDSEIRHEWEKLAVEEVRRDSLTGLYTMDTVKDIVTYLIREEKESQCALSLIHMIGGERCENTQRFIAVILSMALGMDCVVGQYSRDAILAFIPDAGSQFDVKRRIEDAFAYLRSSMTDNSEISGLRFIAGTVTGRRSEADYEEMLARAEHLCNMGKDIAVDTVVFSTEDEDWAWMRAHRDTSEEGIIVIDKEAEKSLTSEKQTAALQCMSDMLSSESLDTSLMDVLRNLGQFYHAARTSILSVSSDKQTVDMDYEWTSREIPSIRYAMRGVPMNKLPLIRNCYQKGVPVAMESPTFSDPSDTGTGWRFGVYPLTQGREIIGFICVENAREHLDDTELLDILASYITAEKKRFRNMAAPVVSGAQDALTNIPNLNSNTDVVHSLDSDSYSSMGVLSLDVPDYSELDSNYSVEYGKKMMMFIADTLTQVFENAYIFRAWDTEFLVLSPNIIQEVFIDKCTTLCTIIQRRYPGQVRMANVWAEGIFSARNMVREAQAVMRNENVRESALEHETVTEKTQESKVSWKNFVPYFQPKIDMRDGSLIGAEALVRKIGDDGTVISPNRFIEEMEKEGTICELDLFMLDAVFQQLREWKHKKYPLPRISVNISRVTLFHSSSFAAVLEIQSRYPEIPADKIELEITETAGDMEKATLAKVVDNFRKCGIQFELDDFGSGYANISMLSGIHFQAVKLDRSLVNDLPDSEISRMIVENVAQICKAFGIRCIAEGVETQQQVEALIEAGCVYGQGFYYAKPLPVREFEKRYLI